jgi:hypothetical protein
MSYIGFGLLLVWEAIVLWVLWTSLSRSRFTALIMRFSFIHWDARPTSHPGDGVRLIEPFRLLALGASGLMALVAGATIGAIAGGL